MKPLHILITNHALANYAGTELYVRDVALSLKKRGHFPILYSQILGRVAEDLRAEGIPLVKDLRQVPRTPDVIHGHHNLEVLTALCFFPNTPAMFICHGYRPWQEHPPLFPRIYRYLAVDQPCLDRLLENGIPAERTEKLLNFVDLKRFAPRRPLPPFPQKALVFSNTMTEHTGIPVIRKACRMLGIALNVVGFRSGNPSFEPEKLLPEYDLVFAKGRAALEALAVGCAVITCDSTGLGIMVTARNYEVLRPLNFGYRTLTDPLTLKGVLTQIKLYDSKEAEEVSRRVRKEADMERAVDHLISVYYSVIEDFHKSKSLREGEGPALGSYLMWLGLQTKGLNNRPATFPSPPSSRVSSLVAVIKKYYRKIRTSLFFADVGYPIPIPEKYSKKRKGLGNIISGSVKSVMAYGYRFGDIDFS